jgi:hypothetical protein
MKNKIIKICELGEPQSIIYRENKPISELIKTTDLVEELNNQLIIPFFLKQIDQHCEFNEGQFNSKTVNVEKAAEHYAHNYFNMHETNSYKELRKGFIAGVEWENKI